MISRLLVLVDPILVKCIPSPIGRVTDLTPQLFPQQLQQMISHLPMVKIMHNHCRPTRVKVYGFEYFQVIEICNQ